MFEECKIIILWDSIINSYSWATPLTVHLRMQWGHSIRPAQSINPLRIWPAITTLSSSIPIESIWESHWAKRCTSQVHFDALLLVEEHLACHNACVTADHLIWSMPWFGQLPVPLTLLLRKFDKDPISNNYTGLVTALFIAFLVLLLCLFYCLTSEFSCWWQGLHQLVSIVPDIGRLQFPWG